VSTLALGNETARPECFLKGCIRSWINNLTSEYDKVLHNLNQN
jgi:hypothetical protein